jgi:hypothetical protein
MSDARNALLGPCSDCGKSQVEDLGFIERHDRDFGPVNEAIDKGYILVSVGFGGTSERAYGVAIIGRRHVCVATSGQRGTWLVRRLRSGSASTAAKQRGKGRRNE